MLDNTEKLEKLDTKTDSIAKRVFDAVLASRFTAFIIGGTVVALVLISVGMR